MIRPRIVVAVVLAFLVLVLIAQNTEPIAIRLFFWEFEASRVVLIALAALTGFLCGYVVARIGPARARPDLDID